jgi:hypothetical protein
MLHRKTYAASSQANLRIYYSAKGSRMCAGWYSAAGLLGGYSSPATGSKATPAALTAVKIWALALPVRGISSIPKLCIGGHLQRAIST